MNARLDRDPLTMRYARTVRETRRDPHDYWEGPHEPSYLGGVVLPARRPRSNLAQVAERIKRIATGALVVYVAIALVVLVIKGNP